MPDIAADSSRASVVRLLVVTSGLLNQFVGTFTDLLQTQLPGRRLAVEISVNTGCRFRTPDLAGAP